MYNPLKRRNEVEGMRKDEKKFMWGIVAIVLVSLVIFLRGFVLPSPTSASTEENIKISLSEISGNVKWYEYDSNGVKVRFFAVKASDGSIKTGFDACDICYKNKKGYRQEGNYLVCNNCGKRFAISGLGTENKNPGGCWPGYLPSYVSGEELTIKKADLEGGRWRFV